MANGTIAFDTLSTSGQITSVAKSLDTDYILSGVPKATLHLNSQTTPPTESESLNISSVDDDNAGDFGLHFSSSFNTANYIMTTGTNDGGASTAVFTIDITYGTNTTAATDVEANYVTAGDNRSAADGYGHMMTFCGQLA